MYKLKNGQLVKESNQNHKIQSPNNVVEFRKNLKKYFVLMGSEEIYVRNPKSGNVGIKINTLNSLSDLYEKCKGTPLVSVKVHPKKDFKEYMNETNQIFSLKGYFKDEQNFEIIENQNDFMFNKKYSPMWIELDNKIYREFFMLTLGDFSGYTQY
jgi:hypothetical protein